jgi:hypothetical protein
LAYTGDKHMKLHRCNYKGNLKITMITGIALLLLVSPISPGIQEPSSILTNSAIPYEGILRIYIVEPISRWNNYNGEPYHFGFLDFAFNNVLSLDLDESFTTSITWDGYSAGYEDIQEDNILVIATLFNPEIHKGFSNPPMKYPFEAHYVDACVAATPGNTASNIATGEFTHTVFVEEATAEYCPYCPAMANALYTVYESDQYPFFFTALITKDRRGNVINQVALDHLAGDYNHYAYPTAHIDGGYKTVVGGYDNPDYYASRIHSAGQREVHDVDLSISLKWNGDASLTIECTIRNNEEVFNQPPGIPIITGPSSGKTGVEQTFQIYAEDPDSNDLYYYINWGDDTDIELIGPYSSGRTATAKHNWTEKGTYLIQVMARDVYNRTSDWANSEVSMAKQRISINQFLFLFERYQHKVYTLITSFVNR